MEIERCIWYHLAVHHGVVHSSSSSPMCLVVTLSVCQDVQYFTDGSSVMLSGDTCYEQMCVSYMVHFPLQSGHLPRWLVGTLVHSIALACTPSVFDHM